MNKKRKTPAATGASEQHLGCAFKMDYRRLVGACLIQPKLTRSIPATIHSQLSPYGLFVLKACTEGWGIEGIERALDGFGLDGSDIVNACLNAVSGDPVNAFWQSTRNLCAVLP